MKSSNRQAAIFLSVTVKYCIGCSLSRFKVSPMFLLTCAEITKSILWEETRSMQTKIGKLFLKAAKKIHRIFMTYQISQKKQCIVPKHSTKFFAVFTKPLYQSTRLRFPNKQTSNTINLTSNDLNIKQFGPLHSGHLTPH